MCVVAQANRAVCHRNPSVACSCLSCPGYRYLRFLSRLILAKFLGLKASDRVGYKQLHHVVFLYEVNRVETKALFHCSTNLWKIRARLRDIYMFEKSEHINLMIDNLGMVLSHMLFPHSIRGCALIWALQDLTLSF